MALGFGGGGGPQLLLSFRPIPSLSSVHVSGEEIGDLFICSISFYAFLIKVFRKI